MTMTMSPSPYWRGQIDAKLDAHDRQLHELEQADDKLDVRLTAVERFMWKTLGVALVGAMAGGVLSTVTAYLIVGAVHAR
jgi:hypothetical protein